MTSRTTRRRWAGLAMATLAAMILQPAAQATPQLADLKVKQSMSVQASMAEPVRPCHRLDGFCGYVDESWLSTAIHTLLCPVLHPLLYWFVRGVRKRTPFGQKGPYGLQYD